MRRWVGAQLGASTARHACGGPSNQWHTQWQLRNLRGWRKVKWRWGSPAGPALAADLGGVLLAPVPLLIGMRINMRVDMCLDLERRLLLACVQTCVYRHVCSTDVREACAR